MHTVTLHKLYIIIQKYLEGDDVDLPLGPTITFSWDDGLISTPSNVLEKESM